MPDLWPYLETASSMEDVSGGRSIRHRARKGPPCMLTCLKDIRQHTVLLNCMHMAC